MFTGLASPSHLILVLAILLLLFGAKRIPELAKGLGSGIKEFRKGISSSDDAKPEVSVSEMAHHEARRERSQGRRDATHPRRPEKKLLSLVFGVGVQEMVFIGLLSLIIFGPGKLPQMARDLGQFVNEARRAVDEFNEDLILGEEDGRKTEESGGLEREGASELERSERLTE
jgi:TatA/E family protein of Tat protein translocase